MKDTFTMKNTLTLLTFLCTIFAFSQVSNNVNKAAADQGNQMLQVSDANNFGSSMTFFNPRRAVDGTEYLFDEWNNFGIIQTTDKQSFSLKNINLNIIQNAFVSKIEGDSLFTFNFNNVEKIIINGKEFKNYYWNDDNRVYQVIYEGKEWSIIKGFKVVEVTGSANPMLNRKRDRLVRKSFYYLKSDKGIQPFKLKKNRILKLLDVDEMTSNKIEDYARTNKLSFKKEDELRKILEFNNRN